MNQIKEINPLRTATMNKHYPVSRYSGLGKFNIGRQLSKSHAAKVAKEHRRLNGYRKDINVILKGQPITTVKRFKHCMSLLCHYIAIDFDKIQPVMLNMYFEGLYKLFAVLYKEFWEIKTTLPRNLGPLFELDILFENMDSSAAQILPPRTYNRLYNLMLE